ncbi:hypothetical protein [Streptomyces griseorubiginosus]|uniref:hypothetical protein n=1 Tax=Streptomyces griseorubiginosus TaxID=67304 RepID=UPI0036E8C7F0
MGYKPKRKTYLIQFEEGHEYHGAQARLYGMTYGQWEEATGADGGEGDKSGADSVKRFVEHLASWNLEGDDGELLPLTMDAVKSVDKDLIAALNNAWIQHLIGVHDADPLPDSSPSGEPSLVESVPMEALSPSLAS